MMCESNNAQPPLLYLSAFFEANRERYYDSLLAVSQRGEWTQWLEFVLEGVTSQAVDLVRRVEAMNILRARYLAQLLKTRGASTAIRLIDELFQSPILSIRRAAEVLEITPVAAKRQIDRLVELGVLRQANESKRNLLFLAPEIIAAISDETQVRSS